MSISLNDRPDDLLILPPMEPGLADKFILVKCQEDAVPNTEADGYNEWEKGIEAELPAFAHFLTRVFRIPDHLACPQRRYGVASWKHTELTDSLWALSAEGIIFEAAQRVLFQDSICPRCEWYGTGSQLEKLIRESSESGRLDGVLTGERMMGRYLASMCDMPETRNYVHRKRTAELGNAFLILPR